LFVGATARKDERGKKKRRTGTWWSPRLAIFFGARRGNTSGTPEEEGKGEKDSFIAVLPHFSKRVFSALLQEKEKGGGQG